MRGIRAQRPHVVKLGGSLTSRIPEIVRVFRESGQDFLIVPGGGAAAAAVRAQNLDDDTAHWLAIDAMEETSRLIESCGVPGTNALELPRGITVLFPASLLRMRDPLPHSWDVTSDTIAAWIAKSIGCDLIILKSVDGIRHGGIIMSRLQQPVDCDEVDPCFLPYIFRHRMHAEIINAKDPLVLRKYLEGTIPAGTVIDASV